MHEIRVYCPATAAAGDRPCIYRASWLRDGSYPAASYGHFDERSDYLAQLLSNVIQSFELNLHVYVADMAEIFGRADLLAQIALHPHINLTSLLSPVVEDCIARLFTCGAFADDNTRMVNELRRVVLVLQAVVTGVVKLPEACVDGYAIDRVPISAPMFAKLESLYQAKERGIDVDGIKVCPTVDFNNFTVNEFRQEHWFWKRMSMSGVAGAARLSTDEAEQQAGCRASMVGFANALGDFLALNQLHDAPFLSDPQNRLLARIRTDIIRLTAEYPDDIGAIPIAKLQRLDRRIETLRTSLASQNHQPIVANLRLRLQAASRYLMTLNHNVGENTGLNRGLMAASFEDLMHKGLGDCKSSSDRYGLKEANTDAMSLRYQETGHLPLYSNHYYWPCWPTYWSLVDRGRQFDFKTDQKAFLNRFVDCTLHQFRVRHLMGAAAGTALKALKRIMHPAAKPIFVERGIDFADVKKTADFVKVKAPLWPPAGRIVVRLVEFEKVIPGFDPEAAPGLLVVPAATSDATRMAKRNLGMREFLERVDVIIDRLRTQLSTQTALLASMTSQAHLPDDTAQLVQMLLPKPGDFARQLGDLGAAGGDVPLSFATALTRMMASGGCFQSVLEKLKIDAGFRQFYQNLLFVQAPADLRSYFCDPKHAKYWQAWQASVAERAPSLLGTVLLDRMAHHTSLSVQIWRNKGRIVLLSAASALTGYGLSLVFSTDFDWGDSRNFGSAAMLCAESLGLICLKSVKQTITSVFAFCAYRSANSQLSAVFQGSEEEAEFHARVAKDFLHHNTRDRDGARSIIAAAGQAACGRRCDEAGMRATIAFKTLAALITVGASAAAIWLFFSVMFSCLGLPENKRPDKLLFDLGTFMFLGAATYIAMQGRQAYHSVKTVSEQQQRMTATTVPFKPIDPDTAPTMG